MTTGTSENSVCLLVEDQERTREFLKKVISSAFPGLGIVVKANQREALKWLNDRQGQPEKLRLLFSLVDLGLPDGSGLQIIRKLSELEEGSRTVVITIYDDDAYLFDALAAGAHGYLLKDEDPKFLAEMLKRIEHDEPPLSPAIARRLLERFREPVSAPPVTDTRLSPRERETLTLLAKGLTVPEAAGQLGLSAQTVAGYVKIIYQKLHVSNRAAATREAIRRGLV